MASPYRVFFASPLDSAGRPACTYCISYIDFFATDFDMGAQKLKIQKIKYYKMYVNKMMYLHTFNQFFYNVKSISASRIKWDFLLVELFNI